jgi:transporter family-2 protein
MLYLFAAVAGVLNAVQAGANAGLGKALENKMAAGVAVVAINLAAMLLIGAASGQLGWPGLQRIAAAPWWAWLGGAIGAIYLLSQLFVAGQVGSGVFIALTVTATVAMSLVLDHYGLLGFDVRPASWGRIAGALFMCVGLGLIAKF